MCEVTGSRRASVDLPQGGLEVPCTLKFVGEKKFVTRCAGCCLVKRDLLCHMREM